MYKRQAKDNEERMMHCHNMLERGLSLGMEATDLWFCLLYTSAQKGLSLHFA